VYEEGVDDDTLAGGIGHVPGTPLPGETGNAALAAHGILIFAGLEKYRSAT